MYKTQLHSYQEEVVDFFETRSGVLHAAMGTGKSLMAIHIAIRRIQADDIHRALIVVPLGVMKHIQDEILKHTEYTLSDTLLYHGKSRVNSLANSRASFIIAGYTSVRMDYSRRQDKTPYNSALPYGLMNVPFSIVICDEAQNVRNPSCLTHLACKELQANNFLCMSGTPLINKTRDIQSIASVAGTPIHLHTSVDEWKTECYKYVPRSVIELPEINYNTINVDFTEAQGSVYESLKLRSRSVLSDYLESHTIDKLGIVLAMISRLRQASVHHQSLAKHIEPGTVHHSGKTECIADIVFDKIEQDEKIVVFSSSKRSLVLLKELLDEYDNNMVMMYTGEMSTTQRDRVVKDFHDNPDRKVLLMSILAGGTGIELTPANNVIIMDPWWNIAIEEQAIARCYRFGQTKPVNVYRILTTNSIEEWITTLQQHKDNDIRGFYGLSPKEVNFNLVDIFRKHVQAPMHVYVPIHAPVVPEPIRKILPESHPDYVPTRLRHISPERLSRVSLSKTVDTQCDICTHVCDHFVTLRCNHTYCQECFVSWDANCESKHNPHTCPMCRAEY